MLDTAADALPPALAALADDPKLLDALAREAKRKLSHLKLALFRPYPKQRELIAAGASNKTRLFLAGNRSGKSEICAFEVACHATGRYPDWWDGKRFQDPVTCISAGHTVLTTRDVLQKKLLGEPLLVGEYGTGFIPKDSLGEWSFHRGVAQAVDTVAVRHESGGWSKILFRSFESGVERWMGTEAHCIHLDEEAPEDIFGEALTRTATTKGIVLLSFTPLAGPTSLVMRFLGDKPPGAVVRASIDDNLGLTLADIEEVEKGWAAHEREARRKGVPMLGSGRVYPVPDADIAAKEAFAVPSSWPVIAGVDFGYSTEFAAVKLAHDREADVLYCVAAFKASEQTPAQHAATLRAWGRGLPVAWPHDGMANERGSGRPLAEQYVAAGVGMLPENAKFEDGSASVEAGIQLLLERMTTGRFKVFPHLKEVFDELHVYHRANGRIQKREDHLMDALRYAAVSLRHARTAAEVRGLGKLKRGLRIV